MTSRTLTPTDSNDASAPPPRTPGRIRRLVGRAAGIAGIAALILVLLGVAAAFAGEDDPAGALLVLAVPVLAFAAIAGPVARWGPSGVLLTFGVLLVIAGVAAALTANVAQQTATTLYAGDDDNDGLTDEDGFGDADGSEDDVRRVDGVEEFQNHDDDDSDGKVDEDPAPVVVQHPEADAVITASRELALGVGVLGIVLVALFFALQAMDARHGRS